MINSLVSCSSRRGCNPLRNLHTLHRRSPYSSRRNLALLQQTITAVFRLTIVLAALLSFGLSLQTPAGKQRPPLPDLKAAVIVPGFLTGEKDFRPLAERLSKRGIPTAVVPMPVWHWLPCIGGRSMKPMLERIDYTVRQVCALLEENAKELSVPRFGYSFFDCVADFMDNPGGVFEVGGSAEVDDYPVVEPRGSFPQPLEEPKGRIALIGHSAGGWISRIYLSDRSYGGKAYKGTQLVHSLVTLGTPHAEAPGPAFRGVKWCNREPLPVRGLAVGSIGFPGDEFRGLTNGAYSFCDPTSDGTDMDGDGLTPLFSAMAMEGPFVEKLVLQNVTHFPWSDAGIWGDLFAPELAADHKKGRPWYGDDFALDQWCEFLQSYGYI